MSTYQRPNKVPGSRANASPYRRLPARLLLQLLLAWGLLAAIGVGAAQEQPEDRQQAGLMVQYGDGSIETACVAWDEGFALTSDALLLQSDLDVQIGEGDGQTAVCKIGADGCSVEQNEYCYCQYDPNSDESRLWLVYQLKHGTWHRPSGPPDVYLTRRNVYDGDVEAWVWGYPGTGPDWNDATRPSQIMTFEQICNIATPTPTGTATGTVTPTGTATGTAEPTATRRRAWRLPDDTATATPTATVEPSAIRRTASTSAIYLPLIIQMDTPAVAAVSPAPPAGRTVAPSPTTTAVLDPTETATSQAPAASATPSPAATTAPSPTAPVAPSPTATGAPSPTIPPTLPPPSPTIPPAPTASPEPVLEPTSPPVASDDLPDPSPLVITGGLDLPASTIASFTATPTGEHRSVAAVAPDAPAAAGVQNDIDQARDPVPPAVEHDPTTFIAFWGGIFVVVFAGLVLGVYLWQRHTPVPPDQDL